MEGGEGGGVGVGDGGGDGKRDWEREQRDWEWERTAQELTATITIRPRISARVACARGGEAPQVFWPGEQQRAMQQGGGSEAWA